MTRIEAIEDFHGQRPGSTDTQPQRCEIDARRNLRQRPKQRRHGRQHRPLILEDLRDHVFGRLKPFHRHDRSTAEQRQQKPHGQHEAVEHGQQDDQSILFRQFQEHATRGDILQQVAVREHGPFRMARRPTGVDEHRQIISSARGGRNFCSRRGQVFRIDHLE